MIADEVVGVLEVLAFPDDDIRAQVGALLLELAEFMDAGSPATPVEFHYRSDASVVGEGVEYLLEDANEPLSLVMEYRGQYVTRFVEHALRWHRMTDAERAAWDAANPDATTHPVQPVTGRRRWMR